MKTTTIYGKTLTEVKDLVLPYIVEAGAIALQIRSQNFTIQEKTTNDYVTAADIAVEKHLIENFGKLFPEIHVLAEEGTSHQDLNSEYLWVIDPIDGTVNFMNGLNHWAISVGLVKNNTAGLMQTVLGLVYQPDTKQLYFATFGGGAYATVIGSGQTQKLQVANRALNQSLVAFGLNRNKQESDKILNMVSVLSPNVAGVRRFGCASLEICAVAKGTLVGYFEHWLQPWDIAAGVIILSEAGGVCTNMKNQPVTLVRNSFFCSNNKLHSTLLNYFKF